MTIEVSVNGEAVELSAACTVSQVLQLRGFAGECNAVAVNMEFVPRAEYDRLVLKQGDRIDVVAPVQGG